LTKPIQSKKKTIEAVETVKELVKSVKPVRDNIQFSSSLKEKRLYLCRVKGSTIDFFIFKEKKMTLTCKREGIKYVVKHDDQIECEIHTTLHEGRARYAPYYTGKLQPDGWYSNIDDVLERVGKHLKCKVVIE